MAKKYQTFSEFYPFYLSQHQNRVCRRLHVIGSALSLSLFVYLMVVNAWQWLWLVLVCGYGFAWVGHFFFEKNKPATFTYPLYSFIADWRLFFDVICRRHPW